ncbi:hypothetical protein GCM10020331_034220 [Ectobacillus funiculus]
MSEDKLCFIIVCDKLLTGFDAPIEQVMYLDKAIKEHNLLQAIARTNRTYDKKKTYGLIVDYYGVSRFLEQALHIFNKEDVQGALQNIDTEIPRLQSRHRSAMRFFDYIRKDDLEACLQALEPEDVRNEFDTAFKRFFTKHGYGHAKSEGTRLHSGFKVSRKGTASCEVSLSY